MWICEHGLVGSLAVNTLAGHATTLAHFSNTPTCSWSGSNPSGLSQTFLLGYILQCVVRCTRQLLQFLCCYMWLDIAPVNTYTFALLGPTGNQQCRCLTGQRMFQPRFVNISHNRGCNSSYLIQLDEFSAPVHDSDVDHRSQRLMCHILCPDDLVLRPPLSILCRLIRSASRLLPCGHRGQSISQSLLRFLIFVLPAPMQGVGPDLQDLRDSFALHESAARMAPKVLVACLVWACACLAESAATSETVRRETPAPRRGRSDAVQASPDCTGFDTSRELPRKSAMRVVGEPLRRFQDGSQGTKGEGANAPARPRRSGCEHRILSAVHRQRQDCAKPAPQTPCKSPRLQKGEHR